MQPFVCFPLPHIGLVRIERMKTRHRHQSDTSAGTWAAGTETGTGVEEAGTGATGRELRAGATGGECAASPQWPQGRPSRWPP